MGNAKSDKRGSTRPSRRRRLLWALLATVGTLVLGLFSAELILRLAGFSYELRASIVQGTQAADLRSRYDGCEIDRERIWVSKDYYEKLDRAVAEKPDVLFTGDSCTELGSYDRRFAELVRAAFPGKTIRVAKLAVTGWSTQQGLEQMKRDVFRIRPRVVTIYYGWNDHWNSIGITDEEVTRLNASPLFHLRSLRLVQLLTMAYVGSRQSRQDRPPLRVSPQGFRQNLIEMLNVAETIGAIPLLLTAPTSHERGREPKRLAGRWVTDLNDLVPLHRQYAQIVRAVAREKNAILCDLAAELDELPREKVRSGLFESDGIHLTTDGDKQIGQSLFKCFAKNSLFELVLE